MPLPKSDASNLFEHSKLMIVSEGNPLAELVINRGGKRNSSAKLIGSAESALAWCRKHGAMLIYLPADPTGN